MMLNPGRKIRTVWLKIEQVLGIISLVANIGLASDGQA